MSESYLAKPCSFKFRTITCAEFQARGGLRHLLDEYDRLVGASSDEPKLIAEINNCPSHGAVNADHRCPEFDGILRDAWTGEPILGSDGPVGDNQ